MREIVIQKNTLLQVRPNRHALPVTVEAKNALLLPFDSEAAHNALVNPQCFPSKLHEVELQAAFFPLLEANFCQKMQLVPLFGGAPKGVVIGGEFFGTKGFKVRRGGDSLQSVIRTTLLLLSKRISH